VKAEFEEAFQGVSTAEISEVEQALIEEGMPVEEIQRLCDVHAAVFKGSIADIHRPSTKLDETPGHPIHSFKQENRTIEKLIQEMKPHLDAFQKDDRRENRHLIEADLDQLSQIDKHYTRKENLVFPYLEKYGVTAPPKVMWGVDDEIRTFIKEAKTLSGQDGAKDELIRKVNETTAKITEMIFKEENILFPMLIESFSEDEWATIAAESGEVGYCLYQPQAIWMPVNANVEAKVRSTGQRPSDGYLQFETGTLSPKEITQILNTLPVDITFVDKDGAVKYFSQAKDRIFPRTKTVIGRNVSNCHPPASVHIVEKIVDDLKSGRKDHEDFWIKMGPRYVYIRYFAVKDVNGEFMGVMEVTQDIAPIQEITGEKRLLSEEVLV
jgi:PAS domain S-box-containing protein